MLGELHYLITNRAANPHLAELFYKMARSMADYRVTKVYNRRSFLCEFDAGSLTSPGNSIGYFQESLRRNMYSTRQRWEKVYIHGFRQGALSTISGVNLDIITQVVAGCTGPSQLIHNFFTLVVNGAANPISHPEQSIAGQFVRRLSARGFFNARVRAYTTPVSTISANGRDLYGGDGKRMIMDSSGNYVASSSMYGGKYEFTMEYGRVVSKVVENDDDYYSGDAGSGGIMLPDHSL